MTMRYAHPTPENKRHAVEVLAELFGHPNNTGELVPKEVPQTAS
jgi:hypothetical protein